jgi:hypothetical protein
VKSWIQIDDGMHIARALDDGSYGHLLPVAGNRIGHLKGAIADMQWTLCRSFDEG